MATKAQVETISAGQLAARLSKVTGRTISGKQVRGRVRGDAGTPLLARFGTEVRGSYANHVYSADEADVIATAIIDAHNKRNAASVKWAALGAKAQRASARKASPKVPKAPKAQPETTDTQSEA